MDCYHVAETYRELVAQLSLGEFTQVQRWEIDVVCDGGNYPTTVLLVGILPGSCKTSKEGIDAHLRTMERTIEWPALGRPIVDVRTPQDTRTHSPRCVRLPVEIKERALAVA